MGNKLDKFIRSRIQDREYEFKESYWLDAEKLLDRHERNRSNRPFSLWFVFLLLGAFLGYLAWPAVNNTTNDNQELKTDSIDAPTTTKSPTASTAELTSPTANDIKLPYLNITASEVEETVQSEVNSREFESNGSEVKHSTYFESSQASAIIERHGSRVAPGSDSNDGIISGKSTNNFDAQKASDALGRSGVAPGYQRSSSVEGSDNNHELMNRRSGRFAGYPALDKAGSAFEHRKTLVGSRWFDLSLPHLKIPADLEEKRIKPRVHRFFYGGLAWSAISQANGPFPSGLGAGINVNYKFQKRWSAHTDLFLYYRRGDFDPVKQSSVVNHQFGVKSSVYQMVPTSALELTMPLYVRYHINKHAIEAGISIDYLLAFHGDIVTYSHESVPGATNDDGVNVSRQQDLHLDATGLRRFDMHIMTGYHWHFAHNMSAGARIYFNPWSNRLGDPLPSINANNVIAESRKIDDLHVEQNPLRNLGNWTFGVDLRYYLFNNQKSSKYARRR